MRRVRLFITGQFFQASRSSTTASWIDGMFHVYGYVKCTLIFLPWERNQIDLTSIPNGATLKISNRSDQFGVVCFIASNVCCLPHRFQILRQEQLLWEINSFKAAGAYRVHLVNSFRETSGNLDFDRLVVGDLRRDQIP